MHLFSEWSWRVGLVPDKQGMARLHLGTDTGALLAAPALQVLVTAQHMWPTMSHDSFPQTETTHCKIQSKNSKQFSLWISTNKFLLCIEADIQSFATSEVIIWTLRSTNHINNNSPLMLQSSSPVFFSSFDNTELMLFFFSFLWKRAIKNGKCTCTPADDCLLRLWIIWGKSC